MPPENTTRYQEANHLFPQQGVRAAQLTYATTVTKLLESH